MRPWSGRWLVATAVVVGWLAGCGPGGGPTPPKIRLGEELCAECHMSIDDRRFCGALVGEDGVSYKFDDLGCMKRFELERRWAARPGWVHDTRSGEWVMKDQAWYVQSKGLATPMGSGIAAFSTRQAAEEFAGNIGGSVVSWEGLERGSHDTVR